MSKYFYKKIELVQPKFNSKITDLIIELDYLRKKPLGGSTNPYIFFQLKELFHMLESLGSARIEGNHTTIAEYIETKLAKTTSKDEKTLEILNVEKALQFVDETIDKNPMNEAFIRELHKIVVKGLSSPPKGEGDPTPGLYRERNLIITQSKHKPPDYLKVKDYMEELNQFINKKDLPKYDLLKTALTHHRFVWIHPFINGNGRTVRLITYAQLIKYGFNVKVGGRIINPTAIFCNDRKKYNHFLGLADSGKTIDLLSWSEYVLLGLRQEIEKIDRLLDYEYLSKNILNPAIDYSLERKTITPIEASILKIAIKKQIFQAQDIKSIFPDKKSSHISRYIKRLQDKTMIFPQEKRGRKYIISFVNNYLMRGVVKMLDEHNFLPLKD